MGIWDGEKFIIEVCLQIIGLALGILPSIFTPTKAYRPGLLRKVVGHVESPLEIWVPLANHNRRSRQRFGLQIRDLVFNNARLVTCGRIICNAQLH